MVAELNDLLATVTAQCHHLHGSIDAGAEAHSLRRGSGDKVGPAHTIRKAHVVLDARACACLATYSDCLEHQGVESLGSAANSCPQACGSCADDDEVVHQIRHFIVRYAEARGELASRGTAQHIAGSDDHWEVVQRHTDSLEQGRGIADRGDVDPGVRYL
ncbi:unannotated protein [freshwater metagenome]|uniref:Unannotated protein n=1 Tax=freshwater metagenome TaxID=449393 RepID=A0A6J7KGH8_9ZZZZ